MALAAGGSSVVVNGVTQAVQSVQIQAQVPAPAPVLSLDGQQITAGSNSAFVIAGQTLQPGSSVVVAGTTIALAFGGGNAVVNGVTQALAPTPAPTLQVLDFNGQAITADSASRFVIDGQTLTAGGSLVISGSTISLGAGGATAFVNGIAQPLTLIATPGTAVANVLTVGGQVVSASEVFVLDGQTLAFLGTAASPDVLTINGQTVSASQFFIVSDQTLALDSPVTLGSGSIGTTLALTTDSAGNTVLVSNGQSSTVGKATESQSTSSPSRTSTTRGGIGDAIATGIGAAAPSSSSTASSGAKPGFRSISILQCFLSVLAIGFF